jgi:hypothetical protein
MVIAQSNERAAAKSGALTVLRCGNDGVKMATGVM